MPYGIVHYSTAAEKAQLSKCLGELRGLVAKELSGLSRKLKPEEVSLRLVQSEGLPIAPVEMQLTAFVYPERVSRQDDICKKLSEFLGQNGLLQNYVWLSLNELGHSG